MCIIHSLDNNVDSTILQVSPRTSRSPFLFVVFRGPPCHLGGLRRHARVKRCDFAFCDRFVLLCSQSAGGVTYRRSTNWYKTQNRGKEQRYRDRGTCVKDRYMRVVFVSPSVRDRCTKSMVNTVQYTAVVYDVRCHQPRTEHSCSVLHNSIQPYTTSRRGDG